jgi:hypothetical protein
MPKNLRMTTHDEHGVIREIEFIFSTERPHIKIDGKMFGYLTVVNDD